MSADPVLPERVERALAAVMDATDRNDLAGSFCRAMSVITGSGTVLLAEVDDTAIREVARHESGGQPSQLSLQQVAVAMSSGPTDMVTWHRVTGIDGSVRHGCVTVVDLPTAGSRNLVVIDGSVEQADHETVLLLIDIAAATAERMESEERLHEQESRLRSLGDQIKQLGSSESRADGPDRAAEFASTAALLTDRERDILEDLLRGASNATIAEAHTLSVETVKTHVKHILRKMGASNRAELIARSG